MPIPPLFHSFLHDGPFQRCTVCDCTLADSAFPYLIKKSYCRGEVAYEFAICIPCLLKLQDQLSLISRLRVDAYMEEHVQWEQRAAALEDERDLDAWCGYCLIKGSLSDTTEEYTVCAMADGDALIYEYMPIMLSMPAIEEIMALYSKETRDELDGFIRDHLNQIPDLDKILSGPPHIFV